MKLGKILIIISIFLLLGFRIYHKLEYKEHLKKINNAIYNDYTSPYIGYISIKRLGVKRGIVKGINDQVLDANDIGLQIIDSKIVLAGHSVENVFGKLHKIKINDTIELYLDKQKYTYKVTSIKVVDKTDISSLKYELNLVTCMYNPNKRLVIGAQKNT